MYVRLYTDSLSEVTVYWLRACWTSSLTNTVFTEHMASHGHSWPLMYTLYQAMYILYLASANMCGRKYNMFVHAHTWGVHGWCYHKLDVNTCIMKTAVDNILVMCSVSIVMAIELA